MCSLENYNNSRPSTAADGRKIGLARRKESLKELLEKENYQYEVEEGNMHT